MERSRVYRSMYSRGKKIRNWRSEPSCVTQAPFLTPSPEFSGRQLSGVTGHITGHWLLCLGLTAAAGLLKHIFTHVSDPLGKEEETITLEPNDKINISSHHRILDKDWQPGVGSVTELRDHLQHVCRSNEALGDTRWEDIEGAASHRIASEAWFQQDLSEHRARSSSFTLGSIPIICNNKDTSSYKQWYGERRRKCMARPQFKVYLNLWVSHHVRLSLPTCEAEEGIQMPRIQEKCQKRQTPGEGSGPGISELLTVSSQLRLSQNWRELLLQNKLKTRRHFSVCIVLLRASLHAPLLLWHDHTKSLASKVLESRRESFSALKYLPEKLRIFYKAIENPTHGCCPLC